MVLVLHLFTFLCCANWIFGPLGVVFAARSAINRDRGRAEQAEVLARYSWYCLGAGLVMLVVMVVLVLALALMGLPLAERLVVPY
jgi:putative copper export protein